MGNIRGTRLLLQSQLENESLSGAGSPSIVSQVILSTH